MKEAIKEAQKAFYKDEVPVGAVIVSENQIIARAHNQVESLNDVTAHAEILAITAAENHLGSKFLINCSIYVSLEPCIMCAGAIELSRLSKLVFGARDPGKGYQKYSGDLLKTMTLIVPGILEKESSSLLKSYFQKKR